MVVQKFSGWLRKYIVHNFTIPIYHANCMQSRLYRPTPISIHNLNSHQQIACNGKTACVEHIGPCSWTSCPLYSSVLLDWSTHHTCRCWCVMTQTTLKLWRLSACRRAQPAFIHCLLHQALQDVMTSRKIDTVHPPLCRIIQDQAVQRWMAHTWTQVHSFHRKTLRPRTMARLQHQHHSVQHGAPWLSLPAKTLQF